MACLGVQQEGLEKAEGLRGRLCRAVLVWGLEEGGLLCCK